MALWICSPEHPLSDRYCKILNSQLAGIGVSIRLFGGVTVDAAYATDLFAGALDVTANFYLPQEDTTKVLESVDKDAGEPQQPDLSAQVNIRYSQNDWSALLQTRYISSTDFNNDDSRVADGDPKDARDIMGESAVWIFNTGFNYQVNDTIGLQLNINNLFDEAPSPGVVAAGWDHVYDNVGRFWRFGVTVGL